MHSERSLCAAVGLMGLFMRGGEEAREGVREAGLELEDSGAPRDDEQCRRRMLHGVCPVVVPSPVLETHHLQDEEVLARI